MTNFGSEPFVFDIEMHVADELRTFYLSTLKSTEEDLHAVAIQSLVLEYLVHAGYTKAAVAFKSCLAKEDSLGSESSLEIRSGM